MRMSFKSLELNSFCFRIILFCFRFNFSDSFWFVIVEWCDVTSISFDFIDVLKSCQFGLSILDKWLILAIRLFSIDTSYNFVQVQIVHHVISGHSFESLFPLPASDSNWLVIVGYRWLWEHHGWHWTFLASLEGLELVWIIGGPCSYEAFGVLREWVSHFFLHSQHGLFSLCNHIFHPLIVLWVQPFIVSDVLRKH